MSRFNSLKVLIHVFAVAMFIIQLRTAIFNILDPDFILATRTIDIKDVEPPLIMICPFNQYRTAKLEEYGYRSEYHLFIGVKSNSTVASWDIQDKQNFTEMIDNFLDINSRQRFSTFQYNVSTKRVQFLRYGYCFELQGDLSKPFVIQELKYNGAIMFITDNAKKTYYTIDITSQTGDKMILKKDYLYSFEVTLSLFDHSKKANKVNCEPTKSYNYSKCFDERTAIDVLPIFGCNPPWMASTNQCLETNVRLDTSENSPFQKFFLEYGKPYSYNQPTKAENMCKNPCIRQHINVITRSETPSTQYSGVDIRFHPDVTKFVDTPNYNWFNFVVDVGSSLGTWLGLSFLSILDFGGATSGLARKVKMFLK